jgi:thioesterase domain-containing protein
VQIFSEIDQILGKRLPLATLFEAPTIEKLAQKMSQEPSSKNWKPLVAIQRQGTNPPFFGIHGADGNVLFYRKFSELLGKEQPFYGLQAQGLDGSPIAPISVEDIAADYLEEIRSVQPHGPYLLGGYSFGGLVSYEIACRLHAAGEKVALLALFDTKNPVKPARVCRKVVRYKIQRVLSRGIAYTLLKLNQRFHALISQWVVKRAQNDPASVLNLDILTLHGRASLAYRPRRYPEKITLFRALDQPPEYEGEADLGWAAVAHGGIEVHDLPGNHTTIFWDDNTLPSFARKAAECIRSCLATDELNSSSSTSTTSNDSND